MPLGTLSSKDSVQANNAANARKKVTKADSEFGINENEEEKQVIVSPKSSLISSRVAEPETADLWASKMIEFSSNFAEQIANANIVQAQVKQTVHR